MRDNGSHDGLVNGGKISRLVKSGKIQFQMGWTAKRESSKSKRPDLSTRIFSKRPHDTSISFQADPTWDSSIDQDERKKRTNDLASQKILWEQKVPGTWFPTTYMLGRFYGSIDNLLLESFGSDILYFKYIYTNHEKHVEERARGQNSRSVDRDAISRKSTRRK
jgi:hypothetical protein